MSSEIPVIFTAKGCVNIKRNGICRKYNTECYTPLTCPYYEFKEEDDYKIPNSEVFSK